MKGALRIDGATGGTAAQVSIPSRMRTDVSATVPRRLLRSAALPTQAGGPGQPAPYSATTARGNAERQREAWVSIALGNQEEAKKIIDAVPQAHLFELRYTQVEPIDWESCRQVLDAQEKRRVLSTGW